jgi:signal transduction histidine kinase
LPFSAACCEHTIQESEQVHRDESSEQELLNRLAAIQAAAEILEDNEDLLPSDRRLFLLVIQTEATRLHQMIGEGRPSRN